MADDLSARVQRVEEGLGFSDRAIEELAAEVRELGRRVHDLSVKLAHLEARLAADARSKAESDEE